MWVCDVEIFEAKAESGNSHFATRLQPATLTQTDAEPVTAPTDPDNSSNSKPAFDGGAAIHAMAPIRYCRRRSERPSGVISGDGPTGESRVLLLAAAPVARHVTSAAESRRAAAATAASKRLAAETVRR
jgi:hypothetical protein